MNPNQTRDKLKNANLDSEHIFPFFTKELQVDRFRNIVNLNLKFVHPLTVLTGTNKIGKTSIMAMLACSHIEFQMRNLGTGTFERRTWSRLIKFTKHDTQADDWKYKIKFKVGNQLEEREGRRLTSTKKWSGVAKKESQIENRKVVYIDVDRITPAHACSNVLFLKTQESKTLQPLGVRVKEYFEYVFERSFDLSQIAQYQNRTSFKLDATFTSFNSASGEDVLLSILLDAVQAEKKSLVLIDELELGLHPKIQRRLVDVLMDIATKDQKQFIVTTHSPTLLSSFDRESRIFIENPDGTYQSIPRISINAAFSKMDSEIYPLINLFCEDSMSRKLIEKAMLYIQGNGHKDIHKIVNLIVSGSSATTIENYNVSKRVFPNLKIKVGYAATFDGDQQSSCSVQTKDHIAFLFSDEAPERFLLRAYLSSHPNATLQHHLNNTGPHALLAKCVEQSIAPTEDGVFDVLYANIEQAQDYRAWLVKFQNSLLATCKHFSENV